MALELGGNDLIFADADVVAAVRGAWRPVSPIAANADVPTRLLAERSIYDQVVARAAAEAEAPASAIRR